jgi:hypothetical protein
VKNTLILFTLIIPALSDTQTLSAIFDGVLNAKTT